TLNGTITLNGGCGMNAEFPNSSKQVLQINSVISGTGGLAIDGGIVRLAGPNPNTFTDGVEVGIGAYFEQDYPATLELAKANNVLAVPGLLDVESSPLNGVAPAIVRN